MMYFINFRVFFVKLLVYLSFFGVLYEFLKKKLARQETPREPHAKRTPRQETATPRKHKRPPHQETQENTTRHKRPQTQENTTPGDPPRQETPHAKRTHCQKIFHFEMKTLEKKKRKN